MPLVHLAPYEPGKDSQWNGKTYIAHLLRRAGFGAPPADLERVLQQAGGEGLEAAVKTLFDEAEDQEAEFQDTFERLRGEFADFGQVDQLQAWWCYRLMRTRTPLREKLTLFWHGHFATSQAKVLDTFLMHRQIETLRKLAWGDFAELVLAVSRDPAMLIYLDGESNSKADPNENYARELMELFTLGLGNYTEQDVRAAARAFTGWHREGAEFVFHAEDHDDGEKEFLGRRGAFGGAEIINILTEQPAFPRFLARKLLVFFACPQPPDVVVAEAAEVFKVTGLNVKQLLMTLFLSKFFYSPTCLRTRIASPVELVVGTYRSLGVRFPAHQVRDHINAMGQELYVPPNVKGWEGEQKWINSTTWAARLAFARHLAEFDSPNILSPRLELESFVPHELVNTEMIVDRLADRLLEGRLAPDKRAAIAAFLVTKDDKPQPEAFRTDDSFRDHQVREALGVILSLPDYHTY